MDSPNNKKISETKRRSYYKRLIRRVRRTVFSISYLCKTPNHFDNLFQKDILISRARIRGSNHFTGICYFTIYILCEKCSNKFSGNVLSTLCLSCILNFSQELSSQRENNQHEYFYEITFCPIYFRTPENS